METEQPPKLKIPAYLLPYFPTWYNIIVDTEGKELKEKEYEVQQFSGEIKPEIWDLILEILTNHYLLHEEDVEGERRYTIPLTRRTELESINFRTRYELIRLSDMYDIPLLLERLSEDLVFDIQYLSTRASLEEHRACPLRAQPSLLEVDCPRDYKEQIAREASNRKSVIRELLSCYLGNNIDLINFILSKLPPLGPFIACGMEHTVIITEGGMFGAGENERGQLGRGRDHTTDIVPMKLPDIPDPCAVSCGNAHTMILTIKGEVFAYGSNGFGQLGLGRPGDDDDEIVTSYNTPQLVPMKRVISVVCGDNYTMLLTSDGFLHGCGENNYGQLGTGRRNASAQPYFDQALISEVISVACGTNHTMMITRQGLFGCGNNTSLQLGLSGEQRLHRKPEKVDIPGGAVAVSVACDGSATMILTEKDGIFVCGYNEGGMLGVGIANRVIPLQKLVIISVLPKVLKIVMGGYCSAILTDEGLFVAGKNNDGQLGLGDGSPWVIDRHVKLTLPSDATVLDVSFGNGHTIILAADGLYGCGYNYVQQLGLEERRYNTPTKISIRMGHEDGLPSCAVDDNTTTLGCTICVNEAHYLDPLQQRFPFCSKACYDEFVHFRVPY